MNGEAKPFRRFDQGIPKELVIRFSGKDRLTVIAALDDVLGLAGDDVLLPASQKMAPLFLSAFLTQEPFLALK